jgi:DNA-binding transcriptional LysR family regulator
MHVFARIVETGGISRAAEQLGVAKSGVSRRLAELETRLGVRLINRTTRRSSLTDAGRAYYRGAVKLLGDVAELDALVSDRESSLQGSLKLAAPLSFGLSHLSPAIDEFLQQHPDLSIQVDFSDRQVDLVELGVDLAIRIAELSDSTLQARKICPIRRLICASPDYLERHGMPQGPTELRDHQLLHYDVGGSPGLRLQDAEGREHRLHGRPRLVANNGDFLRDMAIAGHGIIVIPSFIVWQSLAAGDLVPVMQPWWPDPLNTYAVYPQSRYLSRRARAFIDFLADRFGKEPYWDQLPASGL